MSPAELLKIGISVLIICGLPSCDEARLDDEVRASPPLHYRTQEGCIHVSDFDYEKIKYLLLTHWTEVNKVEYSYLVKYADNKPAIWFGVSPITSEGLRGNYDSCKIGQPDEMDLVVLRHNQSSIKCKLVPPDRGTVYVPSDRTTHTNKIYCGKPFGNYCVMSVIHPYNLSISVKFPKNILADWKLISEHLSSIANQSFTVDHNCTL